MSQEQFRAVLARKFEARRKLHSAWNEQLWKYLQALEDIINQCPKREEYLKELTRFFKQKEGEILEGNAMACRKYAKDMLD